MTYPALPWTGGCRCGRVRFSVDRSPLLTMACHCTGCQRMSASAYSLSVAVPSEGFHLTQGEPVIGGLHGAAQHHFCPWCMSWMYTRMEGLDFFVNVRASMFDDRAWFAPYVETWTSEKLPWATTPASRSYAQLPSMDEYKGLMKDYAAQAAAR